AGALGGRDVTADLSHQGVEGERLECDRLTACVRTGDEQEGPLAVDLDVHRNDIACVFADLPALGQEQGMAGPAKGHPPPDVDHRRAGVHPLGEMGTGEERVQTGDETDQPIEVVETSPDGIAQLAQDARGLLLLLAGELDEIIVGVDRALRLDEECLAALGSIVHDPAQALPGFGPNRYDVPAVTNGDESIGKDPVVVARLEQALEVGHDAADIRAVDRGWADFGQSRAGLTGRFERFPDGCEHGDGFGAESPFPTNSGPRLLRQQSADGIPFDASLPDSACLHLSPHSLPSITGSAGARVRSAAAANRTSARAALPSCALPAPSASSVHSASRSAGAS